MESQHQNPEFRIDPENFHQWIWYLQSANNKGADQTEYEQADQRFLCSQTPKTGFLTLWPILLSTNPFYLS